MDLALENGRIFCGGKLKRVNLGIEKGKIAEISEGEIGGRIALDCSGMVVLPGAVDAHVHFRVPGFGHKEGWKTGSMAAAAGGVTTVFDMPNTKPATTTQELLDEKIKIAEKDSCVNFRMHFGVTEKNLAEIGKVRGVNSLKIYMGSREDELLVKDETKMKRVFEIAKKRGFVVCVHAEDKGEEAELIQRAVDVRERTGNKLHICHVSTAEGAELVAEAKRQSPLVSCEVCPHHLFLDEGWGREHVNLARVNPPLRTKKDVGFLWKALKAGTVDCIASDHAPHTLGEKRKGAPGFPGVETMLPLMLDAVNRGKMDLAKAVELCSENPAKIFGLGTSKGKIERGFDADLTVVDMNQNKELKNTDMKTRCGWTPFDGKRIKGVVEKTIVKGKVAYG